MSESMREEFEDFASDQYEWPQAIEKNADGEYKFMTTYQAWITWQASRAALCVELPPEVEADDVADHFGIDEDGMDMAVGISQMVNGAIRTCATFIRAVGVRTK